MYIIVYHIYSNNSIFIFKCTLTSSGQHHACNTITVRKEAVNR
jgi:hypothetical protein